jgi:hypothetical protein
MRDPAVEAMAKIKQQLDEHAHGSMQSAHSDLYDFGRKVGVYEGLLRAVAVIEDILSADDQADAQL